MSKQNSEGAHSGTSAQDQANKENADMNIDPAVIHLGRLWGEHWAGIIVTGIVLFLCSPIVTFPGGNPKTLWWVFSGVCVAACFFIYWAFYVLIAFLSGQQAIAPSLKPLDATPTTQTRPIETEHAAASLKQNSSSRRVSISASCMIPKEIMKPVWFMFAAARDAVALYPIETALLICIKNIGPNQLSISEYSIECQTKGRSWEILPSFSVPRSGKLVGVLDIHKATRIEIADPMLDSVASDISLAPGATISGWSILGQVEHQLTRKFRMRIRDTYGNEFVEIIKLPLDVRSHPSPESCMRFRIPETGIDLSQLPVKQYFKFR